MKRKEFTNYLVTAFKNLVTSTEQFHGMRNYFQLNINND